MEKKASSKDDNLFLIAFSLLSGVSLVPIWVCEYLPMVDLPQHAAQLSIALRWHDPALGYPDIFDFNWQAAQQFTFLVIRLLSTLFPLMISIKVFLSLLVLLLPLSCLHLLKQTKTNRWVSLLSFPCAFNFSFYWGFIAFLTAIPIAILSITLVHNYCRAPTRWASIRLALACHVLFLTHPLVFGFSGLISALVVLTQPLGFRTRIQMLLPLVLALPVPLLWLTLVAREGGGTVSDVWSLGPFRIREFFALIPGLGSPIPGIICLLLPFVCGYRLRSEWSRRIPLVVTGAVFMLAPATIFGTAAIYRRFAVFAIPLLLYALKQERAGPFRRRTRVLFPVFSLVWVMIVSSNVLSFHLESRPFDRILESMEPGKKVLSLTFDKYSEFMVFPAYLHFPVWYQVKKGGVVDFSFAEFFPNRFRYKTRPVSGFSGPVLRHGTFPQDFVWSENATDYDYFLLRTAGEESSVARIFGEGRNQVSLKTHVGKWWLFERVGSY